MSEALRPTSMGEMELLTIRAGREPIGCDISDYSDEWTEGFLAGQENALQALWRRLACECATGCSACCS